MKAFSDDEMLNDHIENQEKSNQFKSNFFLINNIFKRNKAFIFLEFFE